VEVVIVSATPLDAVRAVRRKLRRLEPLIPVALFVAPFGAGGALVAAVHANSSPLIALAIALLIASFSGLVAWVLITDRRATKPPRHVPLAETDWQEFERSFWAHVKRRSDLPPPPRPGRGDEG
jgi:hypothetical protein